MDGQSPGYDEIVKDMTAEEPPAPPLAQNQPNYDDIVQGMTAERAAAVNIDNAGAKPDEAARALELGQQLNVPPEAVQQNLPLYEQQAQTAKNNAILAQNPGVASWVAENGGHASIAQDDYDNLDAISKALIAIHTGKMTAEQSNEMGRLGFEKQLHVPLPGTDERINQLQGQLQQENAIKLDWLGRQLSKVSGFAGGLVDNFINGALPGAGVGAAVGAPEGGVGAVPGAILGAGIGLKADMGRIAAGNTYLALKQMTDRDGKPIDEMAAQTGSVIAGLGTYAIAGLGVGKASTAATSAFTSELVQKAVAEPTIAAALKSFGLNLAKSGVTFATLNAGMEGSNILGEQAAKIIDGGNFDTILNDPEQRQQVMGRLIDAASSGLMLGPLAEIPFAGVHLYKDFFRARQAEANAQVFQNVETAAAASKTAERSTQAFQSFLQSQTDGTPVENLYVPAAKIRELYQAHGVDPEAPNDPLFGFQKDMAQQLAQAEPNGGDVVIPTADYVANLSRKPIGQQLRDDIRLSPDGMSVNEAKAYLDTYRELAQRQGEEAMQAIQKASEPRNRIFEDVQNQLMATGKFKPDQIQQYASLFAARYAARGARLGKDPYALYKDTNLLIRNEDMPAAERGQPGYHVDDAGNISRVLPSKEFRKIKPDEYKLDDLEKTAREQVHGENRSLWESLDYLKNPPKLSAIEKNKEKMSLTSWLKSQGGLKDAGGELKGMDANKIMRGIINNKKGKNIDDMALAAQENGFFEEHGFPPGGERIGVSDFLNFIDQDLRDRNIKVRNDKLNDRKANDQLVEDLDRMLGDHDIPYEGRDNSEIIKEMEEKGLLPAPEELNREYEQLPAGTLPEITASPEFKKWFGDSKIVDTEGKPKVVYHGTGKSLQRFKTPAYFTDEPTFAEMYAEENEKPVMYPVYLSIKKPYRIDGDVEGRHFEWDASDVKRMKKEGYDGVIITAHDSSDIYTVFDPQQVKSIFNRGTFDPADARILHQGPVDKTDIGDQFVLVGGEKSAKQLAQAKEDAGRGMKFSTKEQKPADEGLFADREAGKAQGNLFQGGRGSITFGNNDAIIRLFGKSDLSTLLHEGGHQWLEELRADAQRADAPEQLKADWQTVKNHLGIKDLPDEENIPTAAHEQFARSVERYAMEGKAPSEGLRGAFQRFMEWMHGIYKSVAELNAPINDDIRKVFDRMFATDAEIKQTETVQSLKPLFKGAKEAKMTDAEFEAYRKLADTAQSKTREELMRRALEAVRKERTKEWRDQYDQLKPEVEKEINSRPDIRAMQYMKTGKLLDAPEGVEIPVMKFGKWELDAMSAGIGNDQLPRSVPPMVRENGGYSPDDIAAVLGYESGEKLVDDLVRLRQEEDAVRATGEKTGLRDYMVDKSIKNRLLEKNGDLLSEGSMAEEAMRAVHNSSRADLIAADVAALARQTGKQGLPAKVVREWASGVIDGKLVRDATQLALYERAEAKAGRAAEQALLKGDIEEAFKAKQQQQFSHALYMEARAALDDVNRGLRRMKWYGRQDTIKSMRQDELEQIHAILEKFDLRPASGPELNRRASFAAWVNKQLEEGHEVKAPPDLLEKINQKHYSMMRMTDFRLMADAVENIANIGRMEQKLIKGKERAEFQEEIDKTVEQSAGLKRRDVDPDESYLREARKGMDKVKSQWLSVKAAGRSFDSSLIKMEQLIQWLDRNNPMGQFNQLGFRPLKDARAHENNLLERVKPEVEAAVAHIDKDTLKGWRDRHTLPELKDPRTGKPMSLLKSQIVSIALNMGNESNTFKLTRGYAWDEASVRAVLNRYMTKGDWDYVQGIWDVMDKTLWPELEAREKRMSGLAPEKIEAKPVQTPFGEYRGGYFPVVYDALRFDPTQGKSPAALFEQTYGSLSSKHGSTIERNERAAHPILLSQGVIPRHINSLIHDLAFREPIMSVDRFFRNKEVRGIVENVFGPEYFKQVRPWLKAIANEKVWDERGLQFWDKAAQQIRVNATLVNLGYNPVTIAVHSTTAASNSIAEIGHAATLDGVKAFFGTPQKMAESRDFVFNRSDFMRHRMRELDRDVRDGLRQLDGQSGLVADARRFAYYGISMGDMASAMPTWLGAYSKFLKTMSEDDAIYAADQAVRNAHGSGGVEDIAAIQRGNEFQKLATMFYSFWNHFYNRERDIGRRFGEAKSAGDFAQVLARSVYYFIVPMVIHGLFRPPPGEDEEEGLGGMAKHAATEIGLGLVSGIPVVRDIANSAVTGRDFQATPAAQVFATALYTAKDIAHATGLKEGEVSSKWLKHAIQTAGYTFGLPGAGQVSRYAQNLWDMNNGDTPGPADASEWIHFVLYGNLADK